MTANEIAVIQQAMEDTPQGLIARATLKVLGIECDHVNPDKTLAFGLENSRVYCKICLKNREQDNAPHPNLR